MLDDDGPGGWRGRWVVLRLYEFQVN